MRCIIDQVTLSVLTETASYPCLIVGTGHECSSEWPHRVRNNGKGRVELLALCAEAEGALTSILPD
jgi:hypothetical protein